MNSLNSLHRTNTPFNWKHFLLLISAFAVTGQSVAQEGNQQKSDSSIFLNKSMEKGSEEKRGSTSILKLIRSGVGSTVIIEGSEINPEITKVAEALKDMEATVSIPPNANVVKTNTDKDISSLKEHCSRG